MNLKKDPAKNKATIPFRKMKKNGKNLIKEKEKIPKNYGE